jgi:hypothetical protein
MTSKLFIGIGSFSDPSHWSPQGVPVSGDSASLTLGSATASGVTLDDLTIGVTLYQGHGSFGMLSLQDVTLGTRTLLSVFTEADTQDFAIGSSLQVRGAIVNQGAITFAGGTQVLTLPASTTLTNSGVINFAGYATQAVATDATSGIVNNGLIRVTAAPSGDTQINKLGLPVTGTGSISVSLNDHLAFGSVVSGGQTVLFTGGANAGTTVEIDQLKLFAGSISGFVAGDTLALAGLNADSTSYQPSGTGGRLTLYSGGTAVGSLQFQGSYSQSSFQIQQSGSTVDVTTTVTNAATGSTSPPTAGGVFRFFDLANGTHFYTASVAERDNVLTRRPDLVQEFNGFGTELAQSSATTAVYRFFDTTHGTHFFTASAGERDQIVATRPDLIFESSSTFLEDTVQSAGDVPVYRFFSAADGTHFYTASATEAAGLNPSSFIAEGISFYAPTGNFI